MLLPFPVNFVCLLVLQGHTCMLPSLLCPDYLHFLLLCFMSFPGHILLILIVFVIAWSYSLGFCAVFPFYGYIFTFCVLCHSLIIFTCYVCAVPFSVHIHLSYVDHFCYLCFVFGMLSCPFTAAFWSPAGQRANLLALLCVMFSCVLSLSHVVSCVRCGAWFYRFLWSLIFGLLTYFGISASSWLYTLVLDSLAIFKIYINLFCVLFSISWSCPRFVLFYISWLFYYAISWSNMHLFVFGNICHFLAIFTYFVCFLPFPGHMRVDTLV